MVNPPAVNAAARATAFQAALVTLHALHSLLDEREFNEILEIGRRITRTAPAIEPRRSRPLELVR